MNPPALTAEDFSAFFRELWADCDPFPWQCEFARRLCAGQVPDYVAVPTGTGKTACLDAAVFALAVQAALPMAERTQGRRIFFIVNRRVIVDEAYIRAGELCKKLREAAPDSVTGRVAVALRNFSGESEAAPLTRAQLRGGIYRDRSWAGSLLRPMIICSTVDQAGSRLLFRGYGVSPQARPVHAALVGQDSLLIIDEAHISRPFIQTLEWVKRYRLYQPAGCETVQLPFQLIQMTATPPADAGDDQKIVLSPKDHEHPVLKPRLRRAKPARLVVEPKAKGKDREERNKQLANRLVEEAEKILAEDHPRSIAIMVNRVATARSVAEKMEKENEGQVTLLIGRLRPLDREAATKDIQERLKTGATASTLADGPSIVVSTQCLEVGADLDFDTLVTEAASLDALRQRFGRLNRGGRDIAARAVIVLPGDQDLPTDKLDEAAPCDPIYGNAIPRTWRWLSSLAQEGVVDFGINAMTTAVDALRTTSGNEALVGMLSPTGDAPVLLPAYLDCWVQTNPAPAADPDVALFLHGPQRDMAEVQVCWRADLPDAADANAWIETLALCPPTTIECLPVPLHLMRLWLENGGKLSRIDTFGDAPQDIPEPEKNRLAPSQPPRTLIWRGTKAGRAAGDEASRFIEKSRDIRPGDTLILRTQDGGWQGLGHLPHAPADPLSPAASSVDCAERGQARMHLRAFVRLNPAVWSAGEKGSPTWQLSEWADNADFEWRAAEVSEMLAAAAEEIGDADNGPFSLAARLRHLAKWTLRKRGHSGLEVNSCPGYCGLVLSVRELLPTLAEASTDDSSEEDADALLEADQPQELCDHTRDVLARLESVLALLPLGTWHEALVAAAAVHDWGKMDSRFQAMLRGTTPFAAMASTTFLAKSGSIASSAAARRAARDRAELPEGFRHEMLSVQMADDAVGAAALPAAPMTHALALHLIATHHGYGRPFAPLVDDDTPPEVRLPMNGKTITITEADRMAHPAYALDSGLAERFWQMNRHHGWWGIALLETVLRLADQAASADPQATSKA